MGESAVKLLHIDSSILGENSASRTLTREIVSRWRAAHPQIEAFCPGTHGCVDSRCMLGTAPVRRGAFAQAYVACRDPMTTKKCCCGAFA